MTHFRMQAWGWLPALLLVLSGCASEKVYVPSLERQFEPIPEFTSTKSVALSNEQPSTALVEYSSVNNHHWKANLHDWTDAALRMTQRELVKRGMQVGAGNPKTLKLAITSVTYETAFWSGKGETLTVMRATTRDGYSAEYTGRSATYTFIDMARQTDYSMMNAVEQLLSDPRIVSYLQD
jgi:hypothetical protein